MGLKGGLHELSLADLVEMTSLGGKSGRLTLFDADGDVCGELSFREGRLIGASCGELRAEKAFFALLAMKDGAFDFDPLVPPEDGHCDFSTEPLLMEGMRRLDELARLQLDLPVTARVRLLGGEPGDALEARLAGGLTAGPQQLGDLVAGVLVSGTADEHDTLQSLQRLLVRGLVRVELQA